MKVVCVSVIALYWDEDCDWCLYMIGCAYLT